MTVGSTWPADQFRASGSRAHENRRVGALSELAVPGGYMWAPA